MPIFKKTTNYYCFITNTVSFILNLIFAYLTSIDQLYLFVSWFNIEADGQLRVIQTSRGNLGKQVKSFGGKWSTWVKQEKNGKRYNINNSNLKIEQPPMGCAQQWDFDFVIKMTVNQ